MISESFSLSSDSLRFFGSEPPDEGEVCSSIRFFPVLSSSLMTRPLLSALPGSLQEQATSLRESCQLCQPLMYTRSRTLHTPTRALATAYTREV